MVAIAFAVGLVALTPSSPVSASPSEAADCYVRGLNSLQQATASVLVFDGFGWYTAIGGVAVDPCGTDGSTSIRSETWVSGAQASLFCYLPAAGTGTSVCTQVTPSSSGDQAKATGTYSHPGNFAGNTTWCSHTNAVFVATNGASFMDGVASCVDIESGNGGGGGEDPPDEDPIEVIGECNDPNDPNCGASPILMPLTTSQAFRLTSAKDGVLFDLNADGVKEKTAWTAADSKLGFLAIDRNGNGQIDDGSELFGDHTVAGATNGFVALKLLMPQSTIDERTGGRGRIDANDPIFSKLLLWEDRNHNGISEPDELRPLGDLYSTIGLGAGEHNRRDGNGNLFRYRGFAFFRTAPGANSPMSAAEEKDRQRDIYDVIFVK